MGAQAVQTSNWRGNGIYKFREAAAVASIGPVNFAGKFSDPPDFLSKIKRSLAGRGLRVNIAENATSWDNDNY
jgi:hypothetical protein